MNVKQLHAKVKEKTNVVSFSITVDKSQDLTTSSVQECYATMRDLTQHNQLFSAMLYRAKELHLPRTTSSSPPTGSHLPLLRIHRNQEIIYLFLSRNNLQFLERGVSNLHIDIFPAMAPKEIDSPAR